MARTRQGHRDPCVGLVDDKKRVVRMDGYADDY